MTGSKYGTLFTIGPDDQTGVVGEALAQTLDTILADRAPEKATILLTIEVLDNTPEES